ncbi:MAG: CRISPR-associated protein Cas4, partial [Thermoplasmata archaeon]
IIAYGLEAIALTWLIFSVIYMYMEIRGLRISTGIRKKRGVRGKIAYIDDLGEGVDLLRSERLKLSGRPDFIIIDDGKYIPVEVKTGRVPQGPLFSHIIQIGAYCILVKEHYGVRPPYGVIKYGNVEYQIDFDEELENLVVKKLQEMRDALRRGEVHRNHKRVGKCLHCSRRDVCPEALKE